MKTKNFFTAMTIMMVMGMSTSFAANRGHENQGFRIEYNNRNNGAGHVVESGRGHGYNHAYEMRHDARHHDNHRYDIRGYEDRVRYHNGYWSYYRDGRWYHYDHYIDCRTYYSRPLSQFGKGIVVGAVVGAIIGALAR